MNEISSEKVYLNSFLENYQFFVPAYQRNYTWTQETANQLLEDLLEHLKKNHKKVKSDYYMGNIVFYEAEQQERLIIVDGQQRITTFMLLITAIRLLAQTNDNLSSYQIKSLDDRLKRLIFEEINQENESGRVKIFFSRRNKILNQILNIDLETMDVKSNRWWHQLLDDNSNYANNFRSFYKRLNQEIETYQDFINLINLFKSIVFVKINISNGKNVHKIFEDINSKGQDLSLTDLIKNYMFILLESTPPISKHHHKYNSKAELEQDISYLFEEDIEALGTKKEAFFTNYLIYLKHQHFNKTNSKEVYREFRKFVQKNIENQKIDLEIILKELKEQIKLINFINQCKNFNNQDQEFKLSLLLNKENLLSVIFPLVYKVAKLSNFFSPHGSIILTEKFKDFLILIDKFYTRRYLVNSTNKNLNKFLPLLLKEITKRHDFDLNDLERFLTNVENEMENSALMPTKNMILKTYQQSDCKYLKNNSKELKHIFAKLNFYFARENDLPFDLSWTKYCSYKVDFIQPLKIKANSLWELINNKEYSELTEKDQYDDEQDYYASKAQSWGNVVLVENNKDWSNSEFAQKKKFFLASAMPLTRNKLTNFENWGKTEIENHKISLLELINKYL